MNASFFIAKRYFLSKKKKNFINVISILSMIGVAFGAMALVVVLSVFNGLEDLIRSLYNSFDPEIKVTLTKGKSFEVDSAFTRKIYAIDGVDIVTEEIEDWAHIDHNGDEKLVKIKGVSLNFTQHHRMDSMIVDGELALKKGNRDFALVGRGLQEQLGISLYDQFGAVELGYPVKKDTASSGINPNDYFYKKLKIKPGAVFAIERQYDDTYIFVPLSFAQNLMEYGNKRTALEIKVKEGFDIDDVRDKIRSLLGEKFQVLNSDEQHSSLLKAIKIEKLFVFIVFSFILALASLNIFFSLTMLAIDKKKDVAILFSMGASKDFIKKLFLLEGLIIGCIGAFVGLVLGALLCWIQKTFNLVSMGMETSIVEGYPVTMTFSDFVFTGITILIITIAISYRPAVKASKFILRENLK